MTSILYNSYIYYNKLFNKAKRLNLFVDETYYIIGVHDKNQNIWFNAWALTEFDNDKRKQMTKSKELLNYALNIENDISSVYNNIEKIIIKTILVNSKFYINEKETQLDVILSIICYLTKATDIRYTQSSQIFIYYIKI
jgi:hypothetical protein